MNRNRALYGEMGLALYMVQAVEGVLATALIVVFPSGAKSLDAEDETNRRKALGKLLKALRHRSEISQDFETVLNTFLKMRNEFVHHFMRKFDLASRKGRAAGIEFCKRLATQAWVVFRTLSGAVFLQLLYDAKATEGAAAADAAWESTWESLPKGARLELAVGIAAACSRMGKWPGFEDDEKIRALFKKEIARALSPTAGEFGRLLKEGKVDSGFARIWRKPHKAGK